MAFETDGYHVTDKQQADGPAGELTANATLPTNTSVDVTINQDTTGDGNADNTEVVALSDGTNTYALSNFAASTGADYWLRLDLATTDTDVTPEVDSATVTTIQTLTTAAATLEFAAPTPTIRPAGQAAIQPATRAVEFDAPTPTLQQVARLDTNPAAVEFDAAATGTSAAGQATIQPSPSVVEFRPGSAGVGYGQWVIDGDPVERIDDETATYDSLALTFRVTSTDLTSVLRPLKSDEGQVSTVQTDSGGYSAVDRAGGDNSYSVTPPIVRQPLRQEGTYHVARYEESLVSQEVEEWDVELEFVPEENRTDSRPISETVGSGEWGFTTRYGTIATDRVDADFLGSGADGVERFELVARLRYGQALAFEAALSRLASARVREVVDGTNVAVDDSQGSASTLTVESPTPGEVSSGEYVVTAWESERLNDEFQSVAVEVADGG